MQQAGSGWSFPWSLSGHRRFMTRNIRALNRNRLDSRRKSLRVFFICRVKNKEVKVVVPRRTLHRAVPAHTDSPSLGWKGHVGASVRAGS